ncbi:MAG: NIL domain-containing protein [Candidatus Omnitrophota bacterium]
MTKKRYVLTFPHNLLDKPITYHLIKDYDLVVNILRARVNPNEEGLLVLELEGKRQKLDEAIKYLQNLGVNLQPLTKDIKWNEKACIHCTACISVCPAGAFKRDEKTHKVIFDKNKCIACELCVKACPYHAIEIEV